MVQRKQDQKPFVLGAGLGRTGTMSVKVALEKLGFKCHHMAEILESEQQQQLWAKLITRSPAQRLSSKLWDKVLADYDALVDFPGCLFFSEIKQHFESQGRPVKLLLTVRDTPEKWYESAQETIFEIMRVSDKLHWQLLSPNVQKVFQFVRDVFDNDFDNKQKCIQVYKTHNDWVQEEYPDTEVINLSVWSEQNKGYSRLMSICEVQEPELFGQPMPHANCRAEFQDYVDPIRKVNTTVNIVGLVSAVVVGLGVAAAFYRKE